MYTNLVFLVETPVLERNIERYGIEYLRKNGFSVTILDLSPLILPSAYHGVRANLCDYNTYGVQRVFSYKQLKREFRCMNNEQTLLINAMGYRYDFRKVYRIAVFCGLHFCYFMPDMAPTDNMAWGRSWKEKLQPRNFLNALKNRIPKVLHFTGYADFLICSGGNQEILSVQKKWRPCKPNCPEYFFHSTDYEECLKVSNAVSAELNDYCVFIDQYLPYHPDMHDVGVWINAEKYYMDMRRFFDEVERLYNTKVIIAAHPRADYDLHPGCYGDRQILQNRTCELICNARFVIEHLSNSSGYIALFKKPTLLIVNQEIDRLFGAQANRLCQSFGWEKLKLEEWFESENKKQELDRRLTVDFGLYEAYVRDYMRKDYNGILATEPLWQQIGRFLKEL